MNFLWGLAFLIASYAIQVLLTPRGEKPKPASFQDFDFPQVEEGTPQAILFGDGWYSDWVVGWYGNFRTSAVKSKGGKK